MPSRARAARCALAKAAPLGVVRALLAAHPQAAKAKVGGGRLPLHCALLSRRPPAYAIRALCSDDPVMLVI